MKQLTKDNRKGVIRLEEIPFPIITLGHVLVENIFSAVSIGTEKSSIEIARKNLIQKARSRPDDLKKVMKLIKEQGVLEAYRKSIQRLELPAPIGYSSVGKVISVASDIKDIRKNDIVACAGSGHAEIILVPRNLCVKVPDSVDLKEAAFTTIASISMQGVRQSNAKVGENIAVIGLGLVGQITMQILEASGCNPVGIDISPQKVSFVKELGFDVMDRNDELLLNKLRTKTGGYGFDAVIITASSGSNDPISLATQIAMDKGQITVVGNIKIDISRKDFYKKELNLNMSRSYGPGRYDINYENKGRDYPIGFVRWTENRNMESVLNLLKKHKLDFEKLITKELKFDKSPEFYERLLSGEEEMTGVLFKYSSQNITPEKIFIQKRQTNLKAAEEIKVGVIGAGNFSQNVMLPILSKNKKIRLVGLASSKGIESKYIAKKYGFEYCTSDTAELINDASINCIIILTRHDSHARYVIDCLKANKHVFVEKPLAVNSEELKKIKEAWESSQSTLTVGFNRRYSSLTKEVVNFFKERNEPLILNYVINTGKIDKNHWTHDIEIGAGRIVGELCHFIDFSNFIISQNIVDYRYFGIENKIKEIKYDDSISLIIKYADGSVSNILYVTNGDKKYTKERIEFFSQGSVLKIDDFKSLTFFNNGRERSKHLRKKDKGHNNQMEEFFDALNKSKTLTDFEEIYKVTNMTFNL